jgi:hypothetical protein
MPQSEDIRHMYRKSTLGLSGVLWRTLQFEYVLVWAVWVVLTIAYAIQQLKPEPGLIPFDGVTPLLLSLASGAAHLPVPLLAAYAIETLFSKAEPVYYMTKLTWLIPLLITSVIDAGGSVLLWSRWRFGPLYPSAATWPFFSALHSSVIVAFDIVYIIMISTAQYRHAQRYPVPSRIKERKGGEYHFWSFENIMLWIGLLVIAAGIILDSIFFMKGRE